MANYSQKIQNLKNRRLNLETRNFSFSDGFLSSSYGESIKYALEVMEPIDSTYTSNTYKACERVKNQIQLGLKPQNIDVDFRYQGSVPTNTHIKLYSDIDLLTITERFVSLQPPQIPTVPYKGNPLADLKDMRIKTTTILQTSFPAAVVDDKGSKALSISGGSLNRKIDVIFSNWYDSLKFAETGDEDYRGIYILDRDANYRILNYPFMHIYCVNEKDRRVNGNEKKIIRLLKSLKVDADVKINVSSYDIASLVYRMEDSDLLVNSWEKLKLLENTNEFLLKVINDKSFRTELRVANSTRAIFCEEGASIDEVVKLQRELQDLIIDITREIKPLYGSIKQSYINY